MPRPYQKGTRPTQSADERAAELRAGMTAVERILWSELRGGKIDGFKFRRQHPLGPYVADFFCFEAALVVEVDSDWHAHPDRRRHDAGRDDWMRKRNIETLRVFARSVTKERRAVVERIREVLRERAGASRSRRAPSCRQAAPEGGPPPPVAGEGAAITNSRDKSTTPSPGASQIVSRSMNPIQ